MLEKLFLVNQSIMLLTALFLTYSLLQQDDRKRIAQLESRQTNYLSYLEQKTNNVDAKLDNLANKLEHRVAIIEIKQKR